jgi:hypothetical protein
MAIEIDIVSANGVVIVVVLWSQVDIVSSSSGHFCLAKALKSLIKSGSVLFSQILCFDLAGVVGYVVVPVAVS